MAEIVNDIARKAGTDTFDGIVFWNSGFRKYSLRMLVSVVYTDVVPRMEIVVDHCFSFFC